MKSRCMAVTGMLALAVLGSGCAAFRAKVSDVDVDDAGHMSAKYDFTDMRAIKDQVASELLASPFLGAQPTPPVFVVSVVENRTDEHIEMKALTDGIRTRVLQSGKAQFVNEKRRDEIDKEMVYQEAKATKETTIQEGRQIGAKYMLSGVLVAMEQNTPRQVRVSKTERRYYKLTMEVTDLESGLIVWTTEKEFARDMRTPLIGW